MLISPGARLGSYEILSSIGSGGMGVVYRARDTQLNRIVAIKLAGRSSDTDQAQRQLLREARHAAALNHPNICTIHEIGETDGQRFIVMEYVEGRTMSAVIPNGGLSVDTVVSYGSQTADALAHAHAHGVIHRDLKPANVVITTDGRVKVLDFGLAQRTWHEGASATIPVTQPGTIAGTIAYMAPEVLRGADADARADIWAVGVMMYEMATGTAPFEGHTQFEVSSKILHESPAPLPPNVPTGLRSVIVRCLSKDPEQRYQRVTELREAVRAIPSASLVSTTGSATAQAAALPGPATAAAAQVTTTATRQLPGTVGVEKYLKLMVSAALIVAVALVAVLLFHGPRAVALSEKDTIVVADFENRTGDPVFDETLKQALVMDLGQSPFLNILSDRKMAATMRLMGRSPELPVTGEVARELCLRAGSKALLAGSVLAIGNEYVIGLNTINCATGDTLFAEQARASGKTRVLKALDNGASRVRTRLGESLNSVEKFSTPIEEATTSSLDALKAYSIGHKLGLDKGDVAEVPYVRRAIELDRNFASAYSSLAAISYNLGQSTLATENAKKAFDLRERVSEREKYRISAFYYMVGTGEIHKANEFYELWRQSYPRDNIPAQNLGVGYILLGQYEKALPYTQDALRLEPNSVIANADLAYIQLALNRPADARTTVEQALARHLDSYEIRLPLYGAAFLQDDQQTMQQQLAWASGRAGEEDVLLAVQSNTEAYFGRATKARHFSQDAMDSARRADAKETAAVWQAYAALHDAELGNPRAALQQAMAAVTLMPGKDVRSLAAMALARAGYNSQARKLAGALDREFPQDTIMQGYWLPSIRAAIELNNRNPGKAVEVLQAALPYELGSNDPALYPVYLRGQAYLLAHQGKEAAAEFQKMIDHRGIVRNYPTGALAHLGSARAYRAQGDQAMARAAYEDFLKLWMDADPNVPFLEQAKSEYAKLR